MSNSPNLTDDDGPDGAPTEVVSEPAGEPRGLLLVADGIGGLDLCAGSLGRLVPRSGLPLEVRTIRWGHGVGRWLADLTRSANVARHASETADQVLGFLDRHPGAPVFLLGKSGGAGVMIKVLETLPERSVERVVLLAPAVSPGYDLTRALQSVRREVAVFISPLDFALLGAGTWAFGTIDRVRGAGAGLIGFRMPGPEDDPERREQYAKVRHIRWRPAMARVGYLGGHLAVDLPPFLRRYVVPLLVAGPIDLDEVVSGRAATVERPEQGGVTSRRTASFPEPPSS